MIVASLKWMPLNSLLAFLSFLLVSGLSGQALSVDNYYSRAISEIVSAPIGAPVSEFQLKKYGVNAIAESIAARVARLHIVPKDGDRLYPNTEHPHHFRSVFFPREVLSKRVSVQLYFSGSIVESVLKNGFITTHESQSYGDKHDSDFKPFRDEHQQYAEMRAEVDNAISRLRLTENYVFGRQEMVNALRPKSAMLVLDLPREVDYPSLKGKVYGEIVAVFNEEVLKRTTFTAEDSLNLFQREDYQALAHLTQTPFQDHVSLLTHHQYTGGSIRGFNNYFEAQVWGTLTISDVQEFLVPKNISQSVLFQLKKSKKPIFYYSEIEGREGSGNERGQSYRRIKQEAVSY